MTISVQSILHTFFFFYFRMKSPVFGTIFHLWAACKEHARKREAHFHWASFSDTNQLLLLQMICTQTDIIILHSQVSNGNNVYCIKILHHARPARNCWSPKLEVDRTDKQSWSSCTVHILPHQSEVRQFYFEEVPETKRIYNKTTIFTKMMNWFMCGMRRECNNYVSLTSIFPLLP